MLNLYKYRRSFRARALHIVYLSRRIGVVIVEGENDVKVYQHHLDPEKFRVVHGGVYYDELNAGYGQVIKLKDTIQKLEPYNKKIVFLVDRDVFEARFKKITSEAPLFITDYNCLENYMILADKNNTFFKKISEVSAKEKQKILNSINSLHKKQTHDSDLIKWGSGKILMKILKKEVNNPDIFLISKKMKLSDFPVLLKIQKYLKVDVNRNSKTGQPKNT